MPEFGEEYGPEDEWEPTLLDNWNWIYTTVASVLVIVVFVGVTYYYRQKQIETDRISDLGCHMYLEAISAGPSQWKGNYTFENCRIMKEAFGRMPLRVTRTKEDSELILCITAGAGLYSYLNASEESGLSPAGGMTREFRKACGMFLFGIMLQ